MKKHFKEKKSIATKHTKSYLVGAGVFLLASTLIGGTIYATISSTWTSPSTLEATADAELTSSSWNKLLGNIQYLYDNKANLSVVNTKADLASPTFTGTPKTTNPVNESNDNQIATTKFVRDTINTSISTKANLANPVLTGIPTAPTATGGTSSEQIATTRFVQTAITTAVNNALSSISAGDGASGGYSCNGKSRSPLGSYMTRAEATAGCSIFGAGWYLPSKDQLVSLAGQSCKSNVVGGYSTSNYFWSSTEGGSYSGGSYNISLSSGSLGGSSKTTTHYVLCAHD